MPAPILLKPIPDQVTNERSPFGPLDLAAYFQSSEADGKQLRFEAHLADGRPLPAGLVCTDNGALTGIAAKDTKGTYDILITVANSVGSIEAHIVLNIQAVSVNDEYEKLKAQVWDALGHNLPLPEFAELQSRPFTIQDLCWFVERWGTLTIWDAFNLDPPSEKKLLQLEGNSPHYNIYDKGSCMVMGPKDLFCIERTLADGLQAARVMAREVYKRGWTIEFVGYPKFSAAAWVELEILADKSGKPLEILNYTPSPMALYAYSQQSRSSIAPSPSDGL